MTWPAAVERRPYSALRHWAGLLALSPVLALPLVGITATEAGELTGTRPVLHAAPAGLAWPPLVITAATGSPSASPSAAPAVPSPAAAPADDSPGPAPDDDGEPDPTPERHTGHGQPSRPRPSRPGSTSGGHSTSPGSTPAAPTVPLPDGGMGNLCQAAEQAGRLPANLVRLCHSMYGG